MHDVLVKFDVLVCTYLLNAVKWSEYFLRFDYAFFRNNIPGVLLKRHSRCFAYSLILFVKLTFGDSLLGGNSCLSLSAGDNGRGAVCRVMSVL